MNDLTAALRHLHGNKVDAALAELHHSEDDLAGSLLGIADLHRTEHEIHHVARDIAGWSHQHVAELSRIGKKRGLDLDAEPRGRSDLMAGLKQRAAELLGRQHEPALLLIADLRRVHRQAAGVSLDWEVLAQTAQALEDAELLELAERCHPQTLRQMRWANAKVKELAAQAMVS